MTSKEKRTFNKAKKDYIAQGYPVDIADQYAWDHYYAAKRGAEQKALEVFA